MSMLVTMAARGTQKKSFDKVQGEAAFKAVWTFFDLVPTPTPGKLSLGLINRVLPNSVHRAAVSARTMVLTPPAGLLHWIDFCHPGFVSCLSETDYVKYKDEAICINMLISAVIGGRKGEPVVDSKVNWIESARYCELGRTGGFGRTELGALGVPPKTEAEAKAIAKAWLAADARYKHLTAAK